MAYAVRCGSLLPAIRSAALIYFVGQLVLNFFLFMRKVLSVARSIGCSRLRSLRHRVPVDVSMVA